MRTGGCSSHRDDHDDGWLVAGGCRRRTQVPIEGGVCGRMRSTRGGGAHALGMCQECATRVSVCAKSVWSTLVSRSMLIETPRRSQVINSHVADRSTPRHRIWVRGWHISNATSDGQRHVSRSTLTWRIGDRQVNGPANGSYRPVQSVQLCGLGRFTADSG